MIRLQDYATDEQYFRELAAKYRVMLQEQAQQSTRYKSLFENLPYGTLVVDDLEIVAANQQAETRFGTEDLVGKTLVSVSATYQPDGRESTKKMKDLLGKLEEETRAMEWEFQQSGGQSFRCDIALSPIEFGDVDCVQVVFREKETEP